MELNWLEDFLALAECGNFSRAAQRRNLTQPAFSRRIRALEDWTGTPLFDRSTQPVGLTEAGRRFRPFADETVRRLLQGREEARLAGGAAATALRFAATHALSLTFFPTWLSRLEGQARLGAIHLLSDSMQACEQVMTQGQAQFLLCHAHAAAPSRLEAGAFRSAAVGSDRLVPVCAPDEAGAPRHPLSGAAVSGGGAALPHLAYSPESGMGRIVTAARGGFPAPLALDTVFTSHLAAVLRTLARDGRGVAWLPDSLIGEDLAQGRLVRAGGTGWGIPVEVRLYRPRARQSPAAEAFWALAAEQAPQDGRDRE
ncbi:LysR family transcriptional regulator (plasmid) [Azospirillum baldaniorum]|uniref:Transcriptional regulator, LysR family n=1 Tax=Azospirillum baldaniorum TaxID=1064539 RepID=A0A9P1JUU2_9PROT|nr:LysR family transcriptional regulator [Azospirillum baldaniorum]AWJ91863.1 LysR family transcriptional regulator [Azospirillum baldaniorum]TWA69272.1 DNA-binding transcriptional LysR family regulator [Azospirillum brasilense]CCD00259.1 transcriptional regulator, LysR family [Azospirillum baldaniorum]